MTNGWPWIPTANCQVPKKEIKQSKFVSDDRWKQWKAFIKTATQSKAKSAFIHTIYEYTDCQQSTDSSCWTHLPCPWSWPERQSLGRRDALLESRRVWDDPRPGRTTPDPPRPSPCCYVAMLLLCSTVHSLLSLSVGPTSISVITSHLVPFVDSCSVSTFTRSTRLVSSRLVLAHTDTAGSRKKKRGGKRAPPEASSGFKLADALL